MLKGEFFERYFSERGPFEQKTNGEANVLCPFPHDDGPEKNPSAHVHVGKGVFHCKTCFAQGRILTGGLSEVDFMATVYGIKYEEAIQLFARLDEFQDMDIATWDRAKILLNENKPYMDYLQHLRGLTLTTIDKYDLAYPGDGIAYPVIMYGSLCDIRTYHPNETPKITSRKGATPLLFPFDHWRMDTRPTLLVAGENDCLITRQNGFNALTVTAGEGHFPKVFARLFRSKSVYICYDCDEAGINSSRRVAFILREAGAEVFLIDLKLQGTKEDKDLTDYFVKHGRTAADLQLLIDSAQVYTDNLLQEDKNKEYPLVNLWDIAEGMYSGGKRVSARVTLSGKYDTVMQAPTAIEWSCKRPQMDNEVCIACTKKNKSGWWTLDENLRDLMELVDVTEKQQIKAIDRFIGFPEKCPTGTWATKSRQPVNKVIFTPDVETEAEVTGFRTTEQYAYTVGMNLEDGNRYRAYFKSYAHPLDGQRVFMIVDRVEDSDNALNMFKMIPSIYEQLQIFQGDPYAIMEDKATRMHGLPDLNFKPITSIAHAYNIIYHSPLRFKFGGNAIKGYPEILIVGESRIGKTETGQFFQRYVRIGNTMALKGATTASLQGGADKTPQGVFKIAWGVIPQNNKGLVILDEMSGMATEVLSSLTAMRSECMATVPKIKRGKAPAHTRMIWTSNPKVKMNGQSTAVKDYPNGVQLALELIGSDEDVARFDLILVEVKGKESSPLDIPELPVYEAEVYRNLIYWVWSRTPEQIKFDTEVENYVIHVSKEMNESYGTDVKLFGSEAWKKLSRFAVACAANCFSTDSEGENIIVKKEHVDWARDFFISCYDNSLFRLREYAKERKAYTETNERVNAVVAGICNAEPMVIKTLLNTTQPIPNGNLHSISGRERDPFGKLVNLLFAHNLITVTAQGIMATRRLKAAVDVYRDSYHKSKMIPVSEEGVMPV